MVPVYYCPGHPSNTISSGALKLYVGFQKVMPDPLEHCYFVDPQGRSWRSTYQTYKKLNYLQIENFKVNLHRNRNIFVPAVCAFKKKIYLSLFISVFVVYLLLDLKKGQEND